MPDVTLDKFLGGQIEAWQPRKGYRAGVDAVLLAAAVPAQSGCHVLELGCGAGVASLCLANRVADLAVTGVELQPDYADLARRNAAQNGSAMDVITSDLSDLPSPISTANFDHVFANPPYFDPQSSTSLDPGRRAAMAEGTRLADWIDIGLRRLKPRGHFTMIQDAARLPDVLAGLSDRAGNIRVRPICGRAGQPAGRVLVNCIKGAKGPFRLLPPLVLHEGQTHDRDGDSYTPDVQRILRDGASLNWD